MLVLSRKMGERIHIGEDIFVEVRRVAGNRVTLAVCAPKNVRILRGELFESTEIGGVLDDDAVASEAGIDTVIMRDSQAAAVAENLLSAVESSEFHHESVAALPLAK